jgi:hypothetical protein
VKLSRPASSTALVAERTTREADVEGCPCCAASRGDESERRYTAGPARDFVHGPEVVVDGGYCLRAPPEETAYSASSSPRSARRSPYSATATRSRVLVEPRGRRNGVSAVRGRSNGRWRLGEAGWAWNGGLRRLGGGHDSSRARSRSIRPKRGSGHDVPEPGADGEIPLDCPCEDHPGVQGGSWDTAAGAVAGNPATSRSAWSGRTRRCLRSFWTRVDEHHPFVPLAVTTGQGCGKLRTSGRVA